MNKIAEVLESADAGELTVHLAALEQSLLDPEARTDSDRVAALLADDFIEFGSSGRIWTKATTLSHLASERPDPAIKRLVTDLDVRLLTEEVALVTYAVKRRSPREPDVNTLRSSVWTRTDGRWRMAFHQGTVASVSE